MVEEVPENERTPGDVLDAVHLPRREEEEDRCPGPRDEFDRAALQFVGVRRVEVQRGDGAPLPARTLTSDSYGKTRRSPAHQPEERAPPGALRAPLDPPPVEEHRGAGSPRPGRRREASPGPSTRRRRAQRRREAGRRASSGTSPPGGGARRRGAPGGTRERRDVVGTESRSGARGARRDRTRGGRSSAGGAPPGGARSDAEKGHAATAIAPRRTPRASAPRCEGGERALLGIALRQRDEVRERPVPPGRRRGGRRKGRRQRCGADGMRGPLSDRGTKGSRRRRAPAATPAAAATSAVSVRMPRSNE